MGSLCELHFTSEELPYWLPNSWSFSHSCQQDLCSDCSHHQQPLAMSVFLISSIWLCNNYLIAAKFVFPSSLPPSLFSLSSLPPSILFCFLLMLLCGLPYSLFCMPTVKWRCYYYNQAHQQCNILASDSSHVEFFIPTPLEVQLRTDLYHRMLY